jgi:hypothetical protein
MSIKIEEGKFYRTQSGEKVGPMKPSDYENWRWIVVSGNGECWNHDGSGVARTGSPDLIAEWLDDDTPTRWGRMTSEEKGALLLARHEGEVIEYYNLCGTWRTYGGGIERLFYDSDAYRIKPEPKREMVTLHGCGFYWEQSEQPCPSDTHRITFDTIDGEPDCDSIKMEKL